MYAILENCYNSLFSRPKIYFKNLTIDKSYKTWLLRIEKKTLEVIFWGTHYQVVKLTSISGLLWVLYEQTTNAFAKASKKRNNLLMKIDKAL